jgi:hypothetical protein
MTKRVLILAVLVVGLAGLTWRAWPDPEPEDRQWRVSEACAVLSKNWCPMPVAPRATVEQHRLQREALKPCRDTFYKRCTQRGGSVSGKELQRSVDAIRQLQDGWL